MANALEFIKSKRSKNVCKHNGYIDNITTIKSNIIENKEHNHSGSTQEVNGIKILSAIKQKSVETFENPDNIVHDFIREMKIEDEIIKDLPKLKSLKILINSGIRH